MNLSRRNLLTGASAATLLTAAGPGLRVALGANPTSDILVVLFQRGAADWLQMLSPAGDANYIKARPSLRVPTSGNNPGIGIGTLNGTDLYLSASAPELKALYDAGTLAFVHATGVHTTDRSHFTVQDQMERGGADGETKQFTGWLTRHMTSVGAGLPLLSTVASSSSSPTSLLGDSQAIAIGNAQGFTVTGGDSYANAIRAINGGNSTYQNTARETLSAVTDLQTALRTTDQSSANAAGYTGGALSQSLRSLGQLIKANVGVSTATVDFGSWDMHNNLLGEFAQRTTEFSRSLAAFWKDMANFQSRLTIVTMTEFGRRLQENASQGTDHGSASGMLIMSGAVNGGKIYGTWPGLAANQLNAGDLAVTTDYRQVLAEIITTRHGETNLASVFPTVKYAPLGIMKTGSGGGATTTSGSGSTNTSGGTSTGASTDTAARTGDSAGPTATITAPAVPAVTMEPAPVVAPVVPPVFNFQF